MSSCNLALLTPLFVLLFQAVSSGAESQPAVVAAHEDGNQLSLTWSGDETIEVRMDKSTGVINAPVLILVGERQIAFNGFYVHINKLTEGFRLESVNCRLDGARIVAEHVLRHPDLSVPTRVIVTLWMEPQDRAVRVQVEMQGEGQHLDRLGIGDHTGEGLEARRMFFGRMYVLDQPQAFEVEHNYNTCKAWCWIFANGLTELQATEGPAKGFRYDPALGRYDLFTYCESPTTYRLWFTAKDPQEAIAEYRSTIKIPAPPTLAQLPGRVGVMTAYPILERYEDFLEEWAGRGARDFVWLSYSPTPGDRERVAKYGALYAVYDIYLDSFKEGPRKMEGWAPELVQYRDNGKMVRGYWSSSWLLPELYVPFATKRVMGVLGHEFRNDQGENDWVPSSSTRYSNLKITREEIGPTGLYLDVHASKAPHHYFDHQAGHHGAWEQMKGEKALFDFAREYLGNVPIWSEGGGEDYAGLMDGGWFMDWRPPEELGIHSAKWQYYPFIDQIHRERLLNMGIYYPLDHYDTDMVNAAMLFGRAQGVSVYSGTDQEDVAGRLQVYYMTKGFHKMLGLSRLDRVDFHGDDINCPIVSFSNGARAWINRCTQNWEIEGYTLPPLGYLVKGPDDFLEYRAIQDGVILDRVHCAEYEYFSSESRVDFGPVITDGALAIMREAGGPLQVYEVKKPRGAFEIKLGALARTQEKERATAAAAMLTRDRRIALEFPDWRQPTLAPDFTTPGSTVQVRPVEMRNVLRYEITLAGPS